jgi:Tfp pilus assembly protein PilX
MTVDTVLGVELRRQRGAWIILMLALFLELLTLAAAQEMQAMKVECRNGGALVR